MLLPPLLLTVPVACWPVGVTGRSGPRLGLRRCCSGAGPAPPPGPVFGSGDQIMVLLLGGTNVSVCSVLAFREANVVASTVAGLDRLAQTRVECLRSASGLEFEWGQIYSCKSLFRKFSFAGSSDDIK